MKKNKVRSDKKTLEEKTEESPRVHIEYRANRIQLYNVPVPYDGGELHDIGWGIDLLAGGHNLTHTDHIQKTLDQEFKLASGLAYGASILALYDLKDVPGLEREAVGHLKALFQMDLAFFHPHTLTSTRLIYTSQGPDRVIHNYGYPDAQQYEVNLVSPSSSLAAGDANALEALFGIRDVQKFGAAVRWLTGKWPHLWRFSYRPKQDVERVLALSVISFDVFDCSYTWPARGAVVTPSSRAGI